VGVPSAVGPPAGNARGLEEGDSRSPGVRVGAWDAPRGGAGDFPGGTAIQVSGGLLLVFGMGAILGPLVAGAVMQGIGPEGLFLTMVAAHLAIIGFAVWRILQRAAPPEADKVAFQISVPARSATPETAALGAGEEEALLFDSPDADAAEGRG
jgi:hypothetical protein